MTLDDAIDRSINKVFAKKAQDLYAAYLSRSGGLDWRGNECPLWEDLTEQVRQNWIAVVTYVETEGEVFDLEIFSKYRRKD